MTEEQYDQLLNIETVKQQDGFHKSFHYHRYEPTPYEALEILFDRRPLCADDHVVDFGCGKGRLNFFIHKRFGAHVLGVEMDEDFYADAVRNKGMYLEENPDAEDRILFQQGFAQEYRIKPEDNRFYFFNPFSVQIFMKVVNNILLSAERHPREIEVILYYGSDDYMYYLEDQTAFSLEEEIFLSDYKTDANERFLIYRLPAYV